MIHLVLGGARSGKSKYAEQIIEDLGSGLYIATSQIFDNEMAERVKLHQDRRGSIWETIEEPVHIANIIEQADKPILVDCLTLWLSNLMHYEHDIDAETEKLCDALHKSDQSVVLVSNEVGLGIVPENALARRFRDHAGILNQKIAEIADHVVFIAAGLPLTMKG